MYYNIPLDKAFLLIVVDDALNDHCKYCPFVMVLEGLSTVHMWNYWMVQL